MASPAKAGTGSRGGGMALWKIGRGIFMALCVFWQIFLLAPIVVIVVVSFTSANYMTFPPPGFSLVWFHKVAGLSWFWNSLATSLIVAVVSTVIATAVGVVAARALSRHRFTGRTVVEYILLSPLILPGVVLGFALFNALVFIGMENLGIPNLVAGHVLIGIPFVMRSSWSALAGMDLSLEEAAFSLGANPWTAFWKVVLPTARPGIIAGAILAFTYSFNDLTISVFLTSPEATPLPVQIMSNIEYSADPTPAAVSTLMVGLTLVFFVLIERIVGLKVFTEN